MAGKIIGFNILINSFGKNTENEYKNKQQFNFF